MYENVNDAYVQLVGNRDLLGKPVAIALPDKVFTSGEFFNGQATPVILNKTPNGDPSQAYINFVFQPLRDALGAVQDIFVQGHEVTEQHEAQIALSNSYRCKDEFLAMLAHELRNPLAPISAAAELLQTVKLDEDRVRNTSEIIVRQVDHMTSLVNDLLDVSRVTTGMVKLEKAPLDIRHIVTEAIEQVVPLIQSKRHHLIIDQAPDATIVLGDKNRLIQVIANLVNNAAKYTQESGKILVKTEVRNDDVLIEVIDDGIGMTRELAARVFDLFVQAEVTPDRSFGGLGLGLSLVKSLVELHDGTVQEKSEGIGKGSKFTVCLPRLIKASKQVTSQSLSRLSQKAAQSLRILVVDDNIDVAAMLSMLLEAAGHEVLIEHSAKQALECARIERPDVWLLDIGLPEIDGNELALCLRATPETSKSLLIALTGYGRDDDRKTTFAAGFDHHLIKPVNTKKLASILAQVKID